MSANRKRVLIVHIDEHALVGLEQALEDSGFNITTTWDSCEAAQLLTSNEFDLIVIGDGPPQISAADLLAVVRPKHIETKCIVLEAGTSIMAASLDHAQPYRLDELRISMQRSSPR